MNPHPGRERPYEPFGEREERGEPRRPDETEEPYDPKVPLEQRERDPERHAVADQPQEPPESGAHSSGPRFATPPEWSREYGTAGDHGSPGQRTGPPAEQWPQAGQGVPPPGPGFTRPPGPPAGPPDAPHGQPARPAEYPIYEQPAAVISARVLMFIGAGFGLTLALLFGLVAATPEATQGIEADATRGLPPQTPLVFGASAFVTGVYGVVSLVLASLLGKRSPVVFWTVLVFQVLMLFPPLPSLVLGASPAVVPLLFTVAIIVSLLFPATRGYYRRSRSPRPATG